MDKKSAKKSAANSAPIFCTKIRHQILSLASLGPPVGQRGQGGAKGEQGEEAKRSTGVGKGEGRGKGGGKGEAREEGQVQDGPGEGQGAGRGETSGRDFKHIRKHVVNFRCTKQLDFKNLRKKRARPMP